MTTTTPKKTTNIEVVKRMHDNEMHLYEVSDLAKVIKNAAENCEETAIASACSCLHVLLLSCIEDYDEIIGDVKASLPECVKA